MKRMDRKKLFLVLLILLIFVGAGIAFFFQQYFSKQGTLALVYLDGSLVREIDLLDVDVPYTFTVDTADGGYNEIRVEAARIGVCDTNCPDKVCQDMGMISSTAYPISCLPHKLMIQLVSADKGSSPNEPDAFVY